MSPPMLLTVCRTWTSTFLHSLSRRLNHATHPSSHSSPSRSGCQSLNSPIHCDPASTSWLTNRKHNTTSVRYLNTLCMCHASSPNTFSSLPQQSLHVPRVFPKHVLFVTSTVSACATRLPQTRSLRYLNSLCMCHASSSNTFSSLPQQSLHVPRVFPKHVLFVTPTVSACATRLPQTRSLRYLNSLCMCHASSSNTFSSLPQQSLHVPRVFLKHVLFVTSTVSACATRLPQTRSLRYFNSLCMCHASSPNTFSSLLQQSLHVPRVFLKHVLFVTSTVSACATRLPQTRSLRYLNSLCMCHASSSNTFSSLPQQSLHVPRVFPKHVLFVTPTVSARATRLHRTRSLRYSNSLCTCHASSSNTFSSLLQQSLHVPRVFLEHVLFVTSTVSARATRLPPTRSLRYINSLCMCHASSSNTFSSLLQQSLHVPRVFLKHVLFVTSTVSACATRLPQTRSLRYLNSLCMCHASSPNTFSSLLQQSLHVPRVFLEHVIFVTPTVSARATRLPRTRSLRYFNSLCTCHASSSNTFSSLPQQSLHVPRVFPEHVIFVTSTVSACATRLPRTRYLRYSNSLCTCHASSSNTFSSLLQQSLHVPRVFLKHVLFVTSTVSACATRLPQTRSLRYFNSLCMCHASSSNTFSSLLQQSLHVPRVFLKHVLFVTSTVSACATRLPQTRSLRYINSLCMCHASSSNTFSSLLQQSLHVPRVFLKHVLFVTPTASACATRLPRTSSLRYFNSLCMCHASSSNKFSSLLQQSLHVPRVFLEQVLFVTSTVSECATRLPRTSSLRYLNSLCMCHASSSNKFSSLPQQSLHVPRVFLKHVLFVTSTASACATRLPKTRSLRYLNSLCMCHASSSNTFSSLPQQPLHVPRVFLKHVIFVTSTVSACATRLPQTRSLRYLNSLCMCHASSSNTFSSLPQQSLHVPRVFIKHVLFVTSTVSACATRLPQTRSLRYFNSLCMCHASSSNTLSSLPQQSLHVPRVFLKHVIFVTSTASACATRLPQTRSLRYLNSLCMCHVSSSNTLSSLPQQSLHVPRVFLKHVLFVTSTVSACATRLPQTRYLRYLNSLCMCHVSSSNTFLFVTSTVSACATRLPQTRYLRYLNSLCMCHASSSNTFSSLPQQSLHVPRVFLKHVIFVTSTVSACATRLPQTRYLRYLNRVSACATRLPQTRSLRYLNSLCMCHASSSNTLSSLPQQSLHVPRVFLKHVIFVTSTVSACATRLPQTRSLRYLNSLCMCHASSSNTLSSLPQQSLHVPRVFLKHVLFVTSTVSACATRLPQTRSLRYLNSRSLRYLNSALHVPRVFLKHVLFVTSIVSACATRLPQTRYLRYLNSLCMCHASSSNTLSSLPQQPLHVPRVFLKHVLFVTSTVSACATRLPQTRYLRYLNSLCMCHVSSSNTLSSLPQQSLHVPRVFLKHVLFVTSTVSACATRLPQTRYLRYLNSLCMCHASSSNTFSSLPQQSLHVPRVFLKHVIFVTSTVSACATRLPQTRSLRCLNSLCMCHASSSNTLSSLPQQSLHVPRVFLKHVLFVTSTVSAMCHASSSNTLSSLPQQPLHVPRVFLKHVLFVT